MKKFRFSKIYAAFAVLVLWLGVVVYLVAVGDGSTFKGQMFSAPSTCPEILAELNGSNVKNATKLVDAALQKDCAVSEALLNKVESQLIQENL
ncbi:MAG: hypothetical protein ABH856_03020 [Patescibacteria group bacterium]|nr:hypothetical protein [Patescibacteria group bacterium]